MAHSIRFAVYQAVTKSGRSWWLVVDQDDGPRVGAWKFTSNPLRDRDSFNVTVEEGPIFDLFDTLGSLFNTVKAEGLMLDVLDKGRGQLLAQADGFARLHLHGATVKGVFGVAERLEGGWEFGKHVMQPFFDLTKNVKIDETPNEFRVRLRDPSGFEGDSFRRITLRGERPRVFAVVARPTGATATQIQSLRFPKSDGWTAAQVQDWVRRHPDVRKFDVPGDDVVLDDAVDKAVWSTAFINDLPDSAFLYIEPGGSKDDEGKTTPRSLRHLPYRDADGNVDLPHLRNALARLSQVRGLSDEQRDRIRVRAERLLAEAQKAQTVDKRTIDIYKAEDPSGAEERFVMGIVLEPEVRDKQGDIYSAAEVRKAAHWFMSNAQQIGLMHKELLGQGATLLESFIAPAEFKVGDRVVKRGTWVIAVRVNDDDVWDDVKSGRLTGFSIGGSAFRQPENLAA